MTNMTNPEETFIRLDKQHDELLSRIDQLDRLITQTIQNWETVKELTISPPEEVAELYSPD